MSCPWSAVLDPLLLCGVVAAHFLVNKISPFAGENTRQPGRLVTPRRFPGGS